MDCDKVGKLILHLRNEKNMTQKELASMMNISDRTVSKWERGMGCPDISLLSELSTILGVNIERILAGDLEPHDKNGGNMKKVKFYVCPICNNVLFGIDEAEVSCCGRKLVALVAGVPTKEHIMDVKKTDNNYLITINHEMTKAHYISFVAFIGYDRVTLVKLYPEQNAEVQLPIMHGNKLFAYCSEHGLWEINIKTVLGLIKGQNC